ncbi:hypothetical protein E2C01_102720 [Portunus trituberculatus]|uniref:Uncharacterized protein n=1 Tax=Portunus trituberculatus TaxID=210409 RepID=A0A5B7KN83_PORTR|nr:hypothetical protein [Portunus trituberculatus]
MQSARKPYLPEHKVNGVEEPRSPQVPQPLQPFQPFQPFQPLRPLKFRQPRSLQHQPRNTGSVFTSPSRNQYVIEMYKDRYMLELKVKVKKVENEG